jgi:hypothetical protein
MVSKCAPLFFLLLTCSFISLKFLFLCTRILQIIGTPAAGWRLPREVRVVTKNQDGVTGSIHFLWLEPFKCHILCQTVQKFAAIILLLEFSFELVHCHVVWAQFFHKDFTAVHLDVTEVNWLVLDTQGWSGNKYKLSDSNSRFDKLRI